MPSKTKTKSKPLVEDCATCASLEKRVKGLESREAELRQQLSELQDVEQPQPVVSVETIRQSAANLNPLDYTVGEGETFAVIASRQLGNAGHWKKIAILNPELDIVVGGVVLPAGAEIKLPR